MSDHPPTAASEERPAPSARVEPRARAARPAMQREAFAQLLELFPLPALAVDQDRRIVALNSKAVAELGLGDGASAAGRRPGDVVGCAKVEDGPEGCGSGVPCALCGLTNAIIQSQKTGGQVSAECRVMLDVERGAALDMQVVTSPLALDGASVTLVSLRDISAEKRRRVLERVFFHDVLNTAGAMLGVTRLLADAADADADKQYRDMLVGQCENLIEEIKSQKQLVQAETGELETNPLTIPVLAVLRSVHGSYASHEVAAGRHLVIGQVAGCKVESDVPLLRRVLGNLVKNALEATPVGGTVTLWADDDGEHVVFHVNNPGRMPERVRLQIFQRSFSTKGPGRGIGTYSIRLLGERYLGGRVELTTSGGEGTTFRLRIPKRWKAPAV